MQAFDTITVIGARRDDSSSGGEGNDDYRRWRGDDTIYGGGGPTVPDAVNIADDGSVDLAIRGDQWPNNAPPDILMVGCWPNDTIFGEDDDDILIVARATNFLDGGQRTNDTLEAGDGDDTTPWRPRCRHHDAVGLAKTPFSAPIQRFQTADVIDGGTDDGGVPGGELRPHSIFRCGGRFSIINQTVDADATRPLGPCMSNADAFHDSTFSESRILFPCSPPAVVATPRGEVPVRGCEGRR